MKKAGSATIIVEAFSSIVSCQRPRFTAATTPNSTPMISPMIMVLTDSTSVQGSLWTIRSITAGSPDGMMSPNPPVKALSDSLGTAARSRHENRTAAW